jgi:uncharacterized membrane protein
MASLHFIGQDNHSKKRLNMRKQIFSFLSILMVISLLTTTASAGGSVKLSGVSFSLGSLIANGTLTGLGATDVKVILDASGIPLVTCTNQGGNQAPGQNPPKVSAMGLQSLFGNDPVRKNGKSPFGVETDDPAPFVNAVEAGCPNNNWTATIDFVFWTNATITVKSLATDAILRTQNYTCTTTLTTVSCTPVP